jgi:uncharacterized protein involved in exopolysaccharide biosynthesis/Mrp family chromosome partitioning ATPase
MFAIDTRTGGETGGGSTGAAAGGRLDPTALLFGFLRRRWPLVVLLALLGAAVGSGVALLTPDRFAATSQLLIDPRDIRVLQNEIGPQSPGTDATVAFLESQARLIASDTIKRRVIERLSLDADPDFGGPRQTVLQRLGVPVEDSRRGQDPVLRSLAAMDRLVSARRGERTFVIDITTITGDGAKSASVSNALAEAYLDDQTRARSDIAQRASNALSARLSELRERVRVAEERVERYKADNNIVGASGRLVTEEQLSVSSTQLTQARARTADAQAKFDQVRTVRATSIESGATPEALQSPTIANLRAQLGSALTREADAQVLYGPSHPIFVSAQAQVRDARRQIAEELQRIVQAARAELDRARASENAISQQVDRLKRDTLSTGQAAVQLRELERDAEASRQVYQSFLLRARETGEQTRVDTSNARIITEAVAPLEKIGPNRKLFALAGLIVGGMLGVLFGLLLELLRGRTAGLAARWAEAGAAPAAAPGAVPSAHPASARQRETASAEGPSDGTAASSAQHARPQRAAHEPSVSGALAAYVPRRWRGKADAAASASSGDSASAPSPAAPGMLTVTLPARAGGWRKPQEASPTASAFHGTAFLTAAWDAPRGPFGAAILQLRDHLATQETAGRNRKVVVIGLAPGAGASVVALNLTLAAARESAVPLLIDLASGPASLSALLAADAELGAENVIDGSAGLVRAALQDDTTGVFFLPRPAGAVRKPLSCSARITAGLFGQTRRFETVIIDGGSLADGAMAYMLAELTDDIVVVSAGAGDAAGAERLYRRALGADAAKVRAVVLNAGAA